VGPTINCQIAIHVQSYFLVATLDAVELGIQNGVFSVTDALSLDQTIEQKEVGFSQLLIRNGYNIGSMMTRYFGHDFTVPDNNPDCLPFNPTYTAMSPIEVIFLKTVSHKNSDCKFTSCSLPVVDDYCKILKKELKEFKKKKKVFQQFREVV